MNKKKTINYSLLMKRLFLVYRIALLVLMLAVILPHAGAVDDMWVLAGLMSAVAVIGAKMSGTQQKADQAWDWLKRVWLAWVIINGIGAFIAYVRPLFNGLATLD